MSILSEYERKIDPEQLEIGHFVIRMDVPWQETDFPLEGVRVTNQDIRAWMREHCRWVVVDLERSPGARTLRRYGHGSLTQKSSSSPKLDVIRESTINEETLLVASEQYQALDRQVFELMASMRNSKALDTAAARQVVSEVSSALEKNLAALVWLTRIKERDQYTAQHCINTAVLAIGLAHGLDWDRGDVEMAGLAGLLHDLGKTLVDPKILNKPGRLTPEEFEQVKAHTELGFELVREDENVPMPVADAVLNHHERPDGRGYPGAKSGEEIRPLARLVAVVDAYDAITSNRVYDPARSHHEALGILWKERERQFDGKMVEALIRLMGWVSPGTLVRLSDGQIAVVLQTKSSRGLRPVVRRVRAKSNSHTLDEVIDLSKWQESKHGMPLTIAEVLPDGADGINARELIASFS